MKTLKQYIAEAIPNDYGGWILPDGEFVTVPTVKHGQWIRFNADKYGIEKMTDTMRTSEDAWRLPALNKGFVRVLFERTSATFEAVALTRATKAKIIELGQDYLDELKPYKVTLFHPKKTTYVVGDEPMKSKINRAIREIPTVSKVPEKFS